MYDCKKTHDSPYDPKELAIHSILRLEADIISNCGHLYKRTVCFINMVHFTDGENILTYVNFDFSITFYPKLLQKSDKPTDTGWKFLNPVKNANAMQVSINLTVLLTRSILLISFWTRKTCKTWMQLLLTQSDTLMIVTLCPISSLKQQFDNLELTYTRYSLYCEQLTVQGMDCTSLLHSFRKVT